MLLRTSAYDVFTKLTSLPVLTLVKAVQLYYSSIWMDGAAAIIIIDRRNQQKKKQKSITY